MRTRLAAILCVGCLALPAVEAQTPLSTAITYQGRIKDAGAPAEGRYDLQFTLYDALTAGSVVGGPICSDHVLVADGLFTLMLDFGAADFDGSARWIEVAVRADNTVDNCASGAYTTLAPRQPLTATPYALLATQNWALGGNAGTDSSTQFIGTTDNQPLELRINNQRALRLEQAVAGSYSGNNVVSGSPINTITPGVAVATIAGGGSTTSGTPFPNRVTDVGGTVGGGSGNLAGDGDANISDEKFATVSGGESNAAEGYASVGGGISNTASGSYSTVAGGSQNDASGIYGTVGGGWFNNASGTKSTVCGGESNNATGQYSIVGCGWSNAASGAYSIVGGGSNSDASGDYSIVGSGQSNTASGHHSIVGGGTSNTASGDQSVVASGFLNRAVRTFSMVACGKQNVAGGDYSFVAGRRAIARDPAMSGDTDGDEGTFVWADAIDDDFASTGPNQFLIRAAGGVGIGTTAPESQLHVFRGSAGNVTADTNSPLVVESSGNCFVNILGASGGDAGVVMGTSGPLGNAAAGLVFNDTTAAMDFRMLGTTRMSLDTLGRIGIGTNTPSHTLHVARADSPTLRLQDTGNTPASYHIGIAQSDDTLRIAETSVGDRIIITPTAGLVGIARNPTTNRLEVNGEASKATAGNWLANSDARIKTDVQTITHALDTLNRVRLVSFRYTDEYRAAQPDIADRRYLNVIAQEFADVFPEWVKSSGEKLPGASADPKSADDEQEILQVDTYPLTIYTAAAVQELNARCQQADSERAALRQENVELRGRIEKLEAALAKLAEERVGAN